MDTSLPQGEAASNEIGITLIDLSLSQVRREVRSPLRQTGQVCRGVGAHRASGQTQLTEGLQDGIWWQGKFHLVHPLRLKTRTAL